jgi:hypothetical protein
MAPDKRRDLGRRGRSAATLRYESKAAPAQSSVWGVFCQGCSARVLSIFIVGFLVRSKGPFPRPDHAMDRRRRAQERSRMGA